MRGEQSEGKPLLLCGVPESAECKEYSDDYRRNDRNEAIEGTGWPLSNILKRRKKASGANTWAPLVRDAETVEWRERGTKDRSEAVAGNGRCKRYNTTVFNMTFQ